MKTIGCLVACWAISINLSAAIINGCAVELQIAEQSFNNLQKLLEPGNHNQANRYAIWKHYLRVKKEIKQVKECAASTEWLVGLFSRVHPQLNFEISNLTDLNGNPIDVYLQVLGNHQMPHAVYGSTGLRQVTGDPDKPESKFGPGSIVVKIKHCASASMIKYLIHELGHIKYQIPNLASYLSFFRKTYGQEGNHEFGHHRDDPSNQSVRYELDRYAAILKNKGIRAVEYIKLASVSSTEE